MPLTSPQSSFFIFVRTGHSAKSWSPRAAGRKPTAVLNGGEVAAAAARAVSCRSIIKIAWRSRLSASRSRRGDSWGFVWSFALLSPCRQDQCGYVRPIFFYIRLAKGQIFFTYG